MTNNDFDEWNRGAIISSALEYRDKAEYYRREFLDLEKAYNRLVDERDRLRDALKEIAHTDTSTIGSRGRIRRRAMAALEGEDASISHR